MIISTNWIKDFVELPDMSADALATRFTMATCEVEEVIEHNAYLEMIKVVEIKAIEKHPNADKLNLVTFSDGATEKQVVCGAPNVAVGLRVPFAPIGTTLPGGFTLVPKEIRGVNSEGMLCSAVELGLGEDSSGLMAFDHVTPLGESVKEALRKQKDILFDIDNKSLTHRPDLWCHYGMAREFSAAFEKELAKPFDSAWKQKIIDRFSSEPSPIVPVIESGTCCKTYLGLTMQGVEVKSHSPDPIRDRLEACGLRSVNSIVDISNYVMLELGIPNHIFDFDSIAGGKITVRPAGKMQSFTTLDEVERELLATDTVIADEEKPLVIGGIMGGLNSGVNEKTNKLFLEVANWQSAPVRKTSSRLGLRTDSSQRYEKSLDSQLCERTMFRLVELILEQNPQAKIIGKIEQTGEGHPSPLTISTSVDSIQAMLGKEITQEKIIAIFEVLDFHVNENNSKLEVTVPSYRATKDVECEADLIEEIGRIIGYDNIAPTSPLSQIESVGLSPAKKLARKVQDFMTLHTEALEIMTYPLVGEALLQKAEWPTLNEKLVLQNALSPEQNRMRPSLLPSALEAVATNQKRFSRFSFFELGRAYREDSDAFSSEANHLVFVIADKKQSVIKEMINHSEKCLTYLNLPAKLQTDSKHLNPLLPQGWLGMHPHEKLDVQIMGKTAGAIFTFHPLVLKKFKIRGYVSALTLDLSGFEQNPIKSKFKFTPLSPLPEAEFDVTVIAEAQTPLREPLVSIKKAKIPQLKEARIADVFLMENKIAVTIKSIFADPKKTISTEELKKKEDAVILALNKAGFELKQ